MCWWGWLSLLLYPQGGDPPSPYDQMVSAKDPTGYVAGPASHVHVLELITPSPHQRPEHKGHDFPITDVASAHEVLS